MSKINLENDMDNSGLLMNDEILLKIFTKLRFKELLLQESVCKQFKACVQLTVRTKKCLTIGGHCKCCTDCRDISDMFGKELVKEIRENFSSTQFIAKEVVVFDLVTTHMKLEKVLQKCPNIESISLSECYVDYRTLWIIVANCRHLKRLSLDQIYCAMTPELWRKVCRLLSEFRLSSVTVSGLRVLANNSGYFYRSFEYSSILLKQLSNEKQFINNRKRNKNKS